MVAVAESLGYSLLAKITPVLQTPVSKQSKTFFKTVMFKIALVSAFLYTLQKLKLRNKPLMQNESNRLRSLSLRITFL